MALMVAGTFSLPAMAATPASAWRGLAPDQKKFYAMGLTEGVFLANYMVLDHNGYESGKVNGKLTSVGAILLDAPDDMVLALDKFYEEPSHTMVPYRVAVIYAYMTIVGFEGREDFLRSMMSP